MSATPKTRPKRQVPSNGAAEGLAEAIAYEQTLADEAATTRSDAAELTPELFQALWLLARKPIPQGFINHVPQVTGKPYESSGVRSLQVQIDRMDNVWSALWWGWKTVWSEDGKLATVDVWIGSSDAAVGRAAPMVRRSAKGGVERGSGQGNIFKGAETNAGKLAFARIGPGHEVYLGAADFDPDTDESAAGEQGRVPDAAPPLDGISADDAARLADLYEKAKAAADDPDEFARDIKVKLGAMGVPTPSLNRAIASLSPAQAAEFDAHLAGLVSS